MKTAKKLRLLLALAGLLVTENPVNAHVTRNRETVGNLSNTNDGFLSQPKNVADEDNFWTGASGKVDAQEKAAAAAHARAIENKLNKLTKQVKTTKRDVTQIKEEHAKLRREKKENN